MADKRRAQQGSKGGNFTPEQARRLLALPVFAILRGDAVPIFPGTSLAAPSGLVGVFRKPGTTCATIPVGRGLVLPVWLNDRQWERAVVPVLIDPRFQGSNLMFQATASNNLSYLVQAIGNELALSFHEAGYGPLPPDLQ